jgi:hypothetical protein
MVPTLDSMSPILELSTPSGRLFEVAEGVGVHDGVLDYSGVRPRRPVQLGPEKRNGNFDN